MKPHKHAELIKAWADGAEIEFRFKDPIQGWKDWKPNDGSFSNDSWWEYRIKPQEPKTDIVIYPHRVTVLESNGLLKEYPTRDSLKLTFDGETGKLKLAEVL